MLLTKIPKVNNDSIIKMRIENTYTFLKFIMNTIKFAICLKYF